MTLEGPTQMEPCESHAQTENHLLGQLNGGLAAQRPAASLLGILRHIGGVLVPGPDSKAIVIVSISN